jgi:hypothetical protein
MTVGHCLVKCLMFHKIIGSHKTKLALLPSSHQIFPKRCSSVQSLYHATEISGTQCWCFLISIYLLLNFLNLTNKLMCFVETVSGNCWHSTKIKQMKTLFVSCRQQCRWLMKTNLYIKCTLANMFDSSSKFSNISKNLNKCNSTNQFIKHIRKIQ